MKTPHRTLTFRLDPATAAYLAHAAHAVSRLRSHLITEAFQDFLAAPDEVRGDECTEGFTVHVAHRTHPETAAALAERARVQGVSLSAVLRHAVVRKVTDVKVGA